MITFEEYKKKILDYLNSQKEYEQDDIELNKSLPDDLKIEKGLLINDAEVKECVEGCYALRTFEDNSKLRIGDKVRISVGKKSTYAKVIDLGLNGLTIQTNEKLAEGQRINIEVCESVLLDPMIKLLESMEEGKPGDKFLLQLAGIEEPRKSGFGAISVEDVDTIPDYMDDRKKQVIGDALKRPSLYCIQGPPGTGKTAVLATIAASFAAKGRDVLVLANPHQAVNNALNRIADDCKDDAVVKIGELLKAEGLSDSIRAVKTFSAYLRLRKDTKRKAASIVGMTLHAAIVNMGLRTSGFLPSIVLVDEAGQIPVTQASLIGAFGCGSIIFIGDDRQMPPIFHPKLKTHELSKSIFAYVCERYPSMRNTLNVTYRMNKEITDYVSRNFYEVDGVNQKIIASEKSANRVLSFKDVNTDVPLIKDILESEQSIFICNVTTDNSFTDCNPQEAEFSKKLVMAAEDCGLPVNEMAVITPYRRQVKYITSTFIEGGWTIDNMPLVNTVECLQGQDVEMIIISFCASDPLYISQQKEFLFDYHRLNVMVSRAKTKVVMLMSDNLDKMFKEMTK